MNLFELNKEFREAVARVEFFAEENDGVVDSDLEAELDRLAIGREQKALNLAGYIKELEAESNMIKAQEKRLADMREAKENRAERLREYLALNLNQGEKLESPWAKISWRASTGITVDDYSQIPEQYFKIEKKPLLNDIKQAVLKEGIEFQGVRVVHKNHLQIK